MKEAERIDRMIEKLRKIWKANPDWRLCQLVFNVAINTETVKDRDLFYVEDGIFEIILNRYIDKLKTVA